MPNKTLFDLSSENLDLFFCHELEKISPQAKSELPKDIAFKLYRGGGKLNTKSTSKLSFLAKLYVLWKCLNKRWWLVIEDENQGITPGQFMELRKLYKKRDYGTDQGNVLTSYGTMVLANKELGESLSYLNNLSNSPAYNYLMGGKNKVDNETEAYSTRMRYIVSTLMFYEARKKTWVAETGITIPEWLVLLYLYSKDTETLGSPIYKDAFKRAYQSSPHKLQQCFAVLQGKKMVQKTGEKRAARLRITALGKETIDRILTKYVLNW